ncbi:hypothetical protein [Gordonia polyisoprenivorans]|uniref:hypothetical protein n=1 Tax=Gordonia polyisoprenivorans TaxID=84595 RepID=UPI001FCA798D|nr:hypothetical protein [Gordonia polyisoprenivorans]
MWTEHSSRATSCFKRPHRSPEYVLAMKAMVTRKSQGDIDDAVALCHLLSISTQEALEAVVSRYFPGRRFGAQELIFERIIESL